MSAGLSHKWPEIALPESDRHFRDMGAYQLDRYMVAHTLCRKRRHAVDVGAHCGLITRYMIYDFERVTAIEADPECAKLLRKNIPIPKLAVYNEIISDSSHSAHMVDEREGNSGARHMKRGGDRTTVTLDDLDLHKVDLIKIDVQGAELDVLEGARNIIDRDRPVIWFEAEPTSLAHSWLKRRKASLAARIGKDYICGWSPGCEHAGGVW